MDQGSASSLMKDCFVVGRVDLGLYESSCIYFGGGWVIVPLHLGLEVDKMHFKFIFDGENLSHDEQKYIEFEPTHKFRLAQIKKDMIDPQKIEIDEINDFIMVKLTHPPYQNDSNSHFYDLTSSSKYSDYDHYYEKEIDFNDAVAKFVHTKNNLQPLEEKASLKSLQKASNIAPGDNVTFFKNGAKYITKCLDKEEVVERITCLSNVETDLINKLMPSCIAFDVDKNINDIGKGDSGTPIFIEQKTNQKNQFLLVGYMLYCNNKAGLAFAQRWEESRVEKISSALKGYETGYETVYDDDASCMEINKSNWCCKNFNGYYFVEFWKGTDSKIANISAENNKHLQHPSLVRIDKGAGMKFVLQTSSLTTDSGNVKFHNEESRVLFPFKNPVLGHFCLHKHPTEEPDISLSVRFDRSTSLDSSNLMKDIISFCQIFLNSTSEGQIVDYFTRIQKHEYMTFHFHFHTSILDEDCKTSNEEKILGKLQTWTVGHSYTSVNDGGSSRGKMHNNDDSADDRMSLPQNLDTSDVEFNQYFQDFFSTTKSKNSQMKNLLKEQFKNSLQKVLQISYEEILRHFNQQPNYFGHHQMHNLHSIECLKNAISSETTNSTSIMSDIVSWVSAGSIAGVASNVC